MRRWAHAPTTTRCAPEARDTTLRSGSSPTAGSAFSTDASPRVRATTRRPRGHTTSPRRKPTLPELTGSAGGVSPLPVRSESVQTRGFTYLFLFGGREAPVDRQYVGIDFHRRRSVIVRLNSAGERLAMARVANDPFEFTSAIAAAGDAPAVVIEATYGWYWVVDLLQDLGATVHLANPKALNWADRRVKNDVVDATDLADMLRMGRLA